jgi:hypothetical protein
MEFLNDEVRVAKPKAIFFLDKKNKAQYLIY